jgi:diacylglycerol kinase family enzyme
MPGAVFVNPSSGSDEAPEEAVRKLFPGHRVVVCEAKDIPAAVTKAVKEGVDFVAVAGGDGTLRCAAEPLVGTGVPFLPIPAGTRNHFALAVGLCDFETAAAAAQAGVTRPVDVGEVNGRCFLNNSSLGLYPKLVLRREWQEHRMPKAVAQLVAVWGQIRHGHRFAVRVGAERYRAWLLFVGNGRYGEGLSDLAEREALDEHLLDVRLVRADRPLARTRVVVALLLGRLKRSPLLRTWCSADLELALDRDFVEVALDGEVERFEPPLRYRVLSEALTVLVPPPPGTPPDPHPPAETG